MLCSWECNVHMPGGKQWQPTAGWITYSHLQADCLYTGISSGPNTRQRVWEVFTFTLTWRRYRHLASNDCVLLARMTYQAQEERVYMAEQAEWWCVDRQAPLNYLHHVTHIVLSASINHQKSERYNYFFHSVQRFCTTLKRFITVQQY